MKIGLFTLAYTPGGYTTRLFNSILLYSKYNINTHLFLHNSRFPELIEECENLNKAHNISYHAHGFNRGGSLSANEAMYDLFNVQECDIVISASQDTFFNCPQSFNNFIEQSQQYINTYLIIGNKTSEIDTAYFGICIFTRKFWNMLGCFDENFFPVQYEEMDMCKRASMLNYDSYMINLISDSTHDSMMSRRKDFSLFIQQTYITTPLCSLYYNKKWGGEPGHEKFTHPFNDKSIGYYIPWEKHSNPYGKYDRQDQGIVRI